MQGVGSNQTVNGLSWNCYDRLLTYAAKTLPDGTVSKFFDYPWDKRDEILIDAANDWDSQILQVRPPFYNRAASPHWHRLARLRSADASDRSS